MTNTSVLEKLEIKITLLNDIKKHKLCYFGHVKQSNILTMAVEGKIEGKRSRGQPHG